MLSKITMSDLEKEILSAIRFALSRDNGTTFQTILDHVNCYFKAPAHNINELTKRKTTTKGNIFEIFCVMYLKSMKTAKGPKYANVWLLRDVPSEVLTELKLPSRDMGIDIIAQTNYHGNSSNKSTQLLKYGGGEYHAVQSKYRIKSIKKPRTALPWKELATFYALCSEANSFSKHIVMTNADYISRPRGLDRNPKIKL